MILGYATTVDPDAGKEAGEAVGLGPTLLDEMGESAKLSSGTRWSVVAFAVVALLWSANSAARAIRAVHSLAWEGRVGRVRRPLPAALVMLAAIAAFAAVIAGAGKARAELGLGGLLDQHRRAVRLRRDLARASSGCCRTGTRDWRELVPGALLVAVGIQLIHLGTVLFIAGRIERSSETYGSLGVAFTLLFWLFVVSRVIVASAMLNSALALERRSIPPEEVLHA